MRKSLALAVASLAFTAFGASSVSAGPLEGPGNPDSDPALTGGTVIDFTGLEGTYPSGLTIGGVTFGGGTLQVANDSNQVYVGSQGAFLQNNYGSTSAFTFSFADPVDAFAFNLGAMNSPWTLTAFSGASVIDSLLINDACCIQTAKYFGISGANITSATLSHAGGDWVILDNFTFSSEGTPAVPEPSTWAMMLFGFGAVGWGMRSRRSKKQGNVRVRFAI